MLFTNYPKYIKNGPLLQRNPQDYLHLADFGFKD